MKIRTDYVTNSSSSSFILSFKDEDSIYDTLKEQFPKDIESGWSAGEEGYFEQLWNEIKDANRLTQEDIETIVADESGVYWDMIEEIENDMDMNYSEAKEFLKTPDGQKRFSDLFGSQIKDLMNKIGDDKVVVQVNHGDGGEGEDGMLEHNILPNLGCTVARFSHH